ncbi:MAG TPA: hypothetical protein IAB57_00410 [Candidatus Fimivivens faecavium]|nr:hypothetical protein [Candidatus Fimivivens faecavium]
MNLNFEDLGKKIGEIVSTTAQKAGDQVQITKLNIDIAGIEKEIDGVYMAIGRYCYTQSEKGMPTTPEIEEYCADINRLKEQIQTIREQIGELREESRKAEKDGGIDAEFSEVPPACDGAAEEPKPETEEPKAGETPEEPKEDAPKAE